MKKILLGLVLLALVGATTLNTLIAIDNGDYKSSIDKHFKKDEVIEQEQKEEQKQEESDVEVDEENATLTIKVEA